MDKRKKSYTPSLASRGGYSGEVRICAGKWKRTPLSVRSRPGLRPTGSRVRETVFDWLNFLLGGFDGRRALDMFAGSGVLGLEFASRGGTSVLIEKNPSEAREISEICERLHAGADVKVVTGDCFREVARLEPASFDVVFIDPPFGEKMHSKALAAVLPLLRKGGLVYVESPEEEAWEAGEGFSVVREGKAGAVRYQILTVSPALGEEQ